MEFFWIVLEKLWNLITARRRVRAWLQRLNAAQRHLLASAVRAARSSKRRIFGWGGDRGEPASVEALCGELLTSGAVTPVKYSAVGSPRYRFEPWVFVYLEKYPKLLDLEDEAGDGAAGDEAAVACHESDVEAARERPLTA